MINRFKGIITLLIIFVMSVFCSCSLMSNFDEETISTEYGDIFFLSFDSYRMTTLVQDSQSDFYLVFDKKIDENDIIGIENSPNLKAYRLDDVVFYDDGSGFTQFDGDLSKNQALTDLVKSNLLVSYRFFKNNIDFFYNDSSYNTEIKAMLSSICSKEYTQLSEYGLNNEVIKNTSEVEHIEQLAQNLLNSK